MIILFVLDAKKGEEGLPARPMGAQYITGAACVTPRGKAKNYRFTGCYAQRI